MSHRDDDKAGETPPPDFAASASAQFAEEATEEGAGFFADDLSQEIDNWDRGFDAWFDDAPIAAVSAPDAALAHHERPTAPALGDDATQPALHLPASDVAADDLDDAAETIDYVPPLHGRVFPIAAAEPSRAATLAVMDEDIAAEHELRAEGELDPNRTMDFDAAGEVTAEGEAGVFTSAVRPHARTEPTTSATAGLAPLPHMEQSQVAEDARGMDMALPPPLVTTHASPSPGIARTVKRTGAATGLPPVITFAAPPQVLEGPTAVLDLAGFAAPPSSADEDDFGDLAEPPGLGHDDEAYDDIEIGRAATSREVALAAALQYTEAAEKKIAHTIRRPAPVTQSHEFIRGPASEAVGPGASTGKGSAAEAGTRAPAEIPPATAELSPATEAGDTAAPTGMASREQVQPPGSVVGHRGERAALVMAPLAAAVEDEPDDASAVRSGAPAEAPENRDVADERAATDARVLARTASTQLEVPVEVPPHRAAPQRVPRAESLLHQAPTFAPRFQTLPEAAPAPHWPNLQLAWAAIDVDAFAEGALPLEGHDPVWTGLAQTLDRELANPRNLGNPAQARVMRGHLAARVGQVDAARALYENALLDDDAAPGAVAGLLQVALATTDVNEYLRLLEVEQTTADAATAVAIAQHRADVLLATNEQDLARVAVGELLDRAPRDVPALIAQLELALADQRTEDFRIALTTLTDVIGDAGLRASLAVATAALSQGDDADHAETVMAMQGADPTSALAMMQLARIAARQGDPSAASVYYAGAADLIQQADHGAAHATAEGVDAHAHTGPTMVADALRLRALQLGDAGYDGWQPRSAAAALVVMQLPHVRPEVSAHARAYAATTAALAGFPGLSATRAAAAAQSSTLAGWVATAHDSATTLWAALAIRKRTAAPGQAAEALPALATLPDDAVTLGIVDALARNDLAAATALARDPQALRGQDETGVRPDVAPWVLAALGSAYRDSGQATACQQLWTRAATVIDESDQRREFALRAGTMAVAKRGTDDETGAANRIQQWVQLWQQQPSAYLRGALQYELAVAPPEVRASQQEHTLALLWNELAPSEQVSQLVAQALRAQEPALLEGAGAELFDPRVPTAAAALVTKYDSKVRASVVGEWLARHAEAIAAETSDTTWVALSKLRAGMHYLDGGDAAVALPLLAIAGARWPADELCADAEATARRQAGDVGGQDGSLPALAALLPRAVVGDVAQTRERRRAVTRLVRYADSRIASHDFGAAQAALLAALDLAPGSACVRYLLSDVAAQTHDANAHTRAAEAELTAALAHGEAQRIATAYLALARAPWPHTHDATSAATTAAVLWQAASATPPRFDVLDALLELAAAYPAATPIARVRATSADCLAVTAPDDPVLAGLWLDAALAEAVAFDASAPASTENGNAHAILQRAQASLQVRTQRLALTLVERLAVASGDKVARANNDDRLVVYFDGAARERAAFAVRAGVSWALTGEHEQAIARYRAAEADSPAHPVALLGWRRAALRGQLWLDVAEAAQREAIATDDPARRASLFHLAGVALMDKALVPERALDALRAAVADAPELDDAFLRMRMLLEEEGAHEELADTLAARLATEARPAHRLHLLRAEATLARNFLSDRDRALRAYREILTVVPHDAEAWTAIADVAWETGDWRAAADALMARAKMEKSAETQRALSYRLGTLFAEHLADPAAALHWFERALTHAPDDESALLRVAEMSVVNGDTNRALAALDRLIRNESDAEARVAHWHRAARVFEATLGDAKRAERAYVTALDQCPTSADAMNELVGFFERQQDALSTRVHLGRVANAMRGRLDQNLFDRAAWVTFTRALTAREKAGQRGSAALASNADALCRMTSGESAAARSPQPHFAAVLGPEADDVIFGSQVQRELRQIFAMLGERLPKHVGSDLRAHGVTRTDRLPSTHPAAELIATLARQAQLPDVEVFVSSRQPYAFAFEPMQPHPALILGQALVAGSLAGLHFAAAAALKLGQRHLALPARLPSPELGVLVISLVRLFQPDFPAIGVDLDAVATQMQRLRRLIPSHVMTELRPFALAIDSARFTPTALSHALHLASWRAGIVACGDPAAALDVLAARAQKAPREFLQDPVGQGLVLWSISEECGQISR